MAQNRVIPLFIVSAYFEHFLLGQQDMPEDFSKVWGAGNKI